MRQFVKWAGALAGAAVLSQSPEFSQQYLQRLAGQVDALTAVVQDFDDSAMEAGMSREEALSEMAGTTFLDLRQRDMARTFARHARLQYELLLLREASPMDRLLMPHRMADPATIKATWGDYTPAVPLSSAGMISAGAGFVLGWGLLAVVLRLVLLPFRRESAAANRRKAPGRGDPPLSRAAGPRAATTPRLQGARR